MVEAWRDAPGYEGFYQVSDAGRVRSLDRVRLYKGYPGIWKGRTLKQTDNGQGYRQVTFYKDGIKRTLKVHILVMSAFVCPRPDGMECCHNDGDPSNNRLDNLRWDTKSSNQMDRALHGTSNRGERSGQAKLTNEDVREIRRRYAEGGISQRQLGAEYGVDYGGIGRIIRREIWKHI